MRSEYSCSIVFWEAEWYGVLLKTQVLEYWWNFIEQTLDIQAPPFTSPEARLLGVPFTPSCQVFGGFWMSREIHEIQKYITNTPGKQQQSQSLWLFLFNVYIILLMEEILHMYIYKSTGAGFLPPTVWFYNVLFRPLFSSLFYDSVSVLSDDSICWI